VQLQSLAQGLQAEVYVREEHPYQGTASYFRNVQRQHAPRPALAQPPAAAPASNGGGGVDADGGGASLAADGSREGWTLVDEGFLGGSSSSAAAAAAAAAGRQQQQGLANADPAAAVEAAGACVPVTCINLLHANPKKASELMLSSHFQDVSEPAVPAVLFPLSLLCLPCGQAHPYSPAAGHMSFTCLPLHLRLCLCIC
jgi:hypothetical protein